MGHAIRHIVIPFLVLCLAGAGAYKLYQMRPEPKQVTIEQRPLIIDIAEVVKQDISISIQSQGTVAPHTETILISEVSGRVVRVSPKFKAGGLFDQGEVLLQIDDRDYRAELKRAESAVASAQSNLALERGRAEVAYRDWLKFSKGVQRNPQADALAQRKPQLAEAQARLDSALADLSRARDNLDRTTITAPYRGLVRNTEVDIGQYITAGTRLGSTFSVETAEVRLPIPDDRLTYLNLPQLDLENEGPTPRVLLSAQMGNEQFQWQARLVRSEGVLDERSRVLFAVAEIQDPYGLEQKRDQPLRVGTFVNARIQGRNMPDLVVLPRHILRTGNLVWVVDGDNKLVNRNVKLLRTDGSLAYVYEGLVEGERVCLSTIPNAVAGTEIRTNTVVKTSSLMSPETAEKLPDAEARMAAQTDKVSDRG